MLTFYPSNTISFHASEGEKLVYYALQKLNGNYSVIHSYRWLGDESQRRSEGEADFLIIHPAKGILSVEVKAGGVAFRNGNWIQMNRNTGTEKIMDPFGQAAESISQAVKSGLEKDFAVGRVSKFKLENCPERFLKAGAPVIKDYKDFCVALTELPGQRSAIPLQGELFI